MTKAQILERLELAQPLRQWEFGVMSGYSQVTLRRLIGEGTIASVSLPGSVEKRIPVDEARRLLVDLRVI